MLKHGVMIINKVGYDKTVGPTTVKFDIFEAIRDKVKSNGLNLVVIASHKGKSAIKLAETLGDQVKILSVTEFYYDDEVKKKMKKLNITAIEKVDLPIQDNREMRETLMIFGQEIKAALEVALIAKKAAKITGEFITLAGNDRGLNTAILLSDEYPGKELVSDPLKQLKILEFIALPF
jgi:hypothetical protein